MRNLKAWASYLHLKFLRDCVLDIIRSHIRSKLRVSDMTKLTRYFSFPRNKQYSHIFIKLHLIFLDIRCKIWKPEIIIYTWSSWHFIFWIWLVTRWKLRVYYFFPTEVKLHEENTCHFQEYPERMLMRSEMWFRFKPISTKAINVENQSCVLKIKLHLRKNQKVANVAYFFFSTNFQLNSNEEIILLSHDQRIFMQ